MVKRSKHAGQAAVASVLAAALLTGCGGGDGDGEAGKGAGGGAAEASATPQQTARLTVPAAWDGTRGWDRTLTWVPQNAQYPVAVVPGARAVAVVDRADGGFTVRVDSAASGEPLWSSRPWQRPVPKPDAKEHALVPKVLGVEQGGQRFVVLAAHGITGKDDLHEGTEVVRLAVYPAEAKGKDLAPLREIDVPVHATAGEVVVQARGGRVLVAYGEQGDYPQWSAAADLVTGSVTPYDQPAALLPQCERPHCSARVLAAGAAGPLVGLGGGFGVPGRWFSDAVRPEGVAAKAGSWKVWNGGVYGVAGGRFLAEWENEGKNGSSTAPTWSVHDLDSGRLLARMECAYSEQLSGISYRGRTDHPVVASPSGRFLAAGPVAFDIERGKGVCLQGDGNRKSVDVLAVGDDGTAYGLVDSDAPRVTARISLGSPDPAVEALGAGVLVPEHTGLDGAALFVARDEADNLRVSLRRGRP
ncbi:hypothetical protein [Streptomyces sp. cmx-4-9]|uniref:hypothetical protein n=1 Tax=Streptomyces sp. cmx-4-9 TaxID=2790941 RepID=UPI00398028B8